MGSTATKTINTFQSTEEEAIFECLKEAIRDKLPPDIKTRIIELEEVSRSKAGKVLEKEKWMEEMMQTEASLLTEYMQYKANLVHARNLAETIAYSNKQVAPYVPYIKAVQKMAKAEFSYDEMLEAIANQSREIFTMHPDFANSVDFIEAYQRLAQSIDISREYERKVDSITVKYRANQYSTTTMIDKLAYSNKYYARKIDALQGSGRAMRGLVEKGDSLTEKLQTENVKAIEAAIKALAQNDHIKFESLTLEKQAELVAYYNSLFNKYLLVIRKGIEKAIKAVPQYRQEYETEEGYRKAEQALSNILVKGDWLKDADGKPASTPEANDLATRIRVKQNIKDHIKIFQQQVLDECTAESGPLYEEVAAVKAMLEGHLSAFEQAEELRPPQHYQLPSIKEDILKAVGEIRDKHKKTLEDPQWKKVKKGLNRFYFFAANSWDFSMDARQDARLLSITLSELLEIEARDVLRELVQEEDYLSQEGKEAFRRGELCYKELCEPAKRKIGEAINSDQEPYTSLRRKMLEHYRNGDYAEHKSGNIKGDEKAFIQRELHRFSHFAKAIQYTNKILLANWGNVSNTYEGLFLTKLFGIDSSVDLVFLAEDKATWERLRHHTADIVDDLCDEDKPYGRQLAARAAKKPHGQKEMTFLTAWSDTGQKTGMMEHWETRTTLDHVREACKAKGVVLKEYDGKGKQLKRGGYRVGLKSESSQTIQGSELFYLIRSADYVTHHAVRFQRKVDEAIARKSGTVTFGAAAVPADMRADLDKVAATTAETIDKLRDVKEGSGGRLQALLAYLTPFGSFVNAGKITRGERHETEDVVVQKLGHMMGARSVPIPNVNLDNVRAITFDFSQRIVEFLTYIGIERALEIHQIGAERVKVLTQKSEAFNEVINIIEAIGLKRADFRMAWMMLPHEQRPITSDGEFDWKKIQEWAESYQAEPNTEINEGNALQKAMELLAFIQLEYEFAKSKQKERNQSEMVLSHMPEVALSEAKRQQEAEDCKMMQTIMHRKWIGGTRLVHQLFDYSSEEGRESLSSAGQKRLMAAVLSGVNASDELPRQLNDLEVANPKRDRWV